MLCRGCTGFLPKTKKGFQREFFPLSGWIYRLLLIRYISHSEIPCLGLFPPSRLVRSVFSECEKKCGSHIFKRYQTFIGELDERLSIAVYYELLAWVRLYLHQDKDLACEIATVWSSCSLNAGIIELPTTKRLSKQPLKLYQFYTARI